MPELPEVETLRRGLSDLIIDKKIEAIDILNPKSFISGHDYNNHLIGAKITAVDRRGKSLVIYLDNGYLLLIHLKMTGQMVFRGHNKKFGAGHPNDSLVSSLPDRSTRIILHLSNAKLFFNDQRKFGWVKLLKDNELEQDSFIRKLGPDPLSKGFSSRAFEARLMKHPNMKIKAVLLDQSVISGVGNIYADESLWAAEIHPSTLVKDIPEEKIKPLLKYLRAVLLLSIKSGGSTDRNYVNAKGEKGSFLTFANVFRREGQECPRCGHTLIKIRVAGRGTHICTYCQVV